MPKRSSLISRFWFQMVLCIVGISLLFFALSSYLFRDAYSGPVFSNMRETARQARLLLERYAAGEITREDLHAAVNPALSIDGAFFMLLDREEQVLAYTEAAAPYFAGDTLPSLLEELREGRSASIQKEEGNTLVRLAAVQTPEGIVLVGQPTRIFRGAAAHYRSRLFFSMMVVILVVALGALWAAVRTARPARMITEMAERLTQGEQMTVPENLPGWEMQKLAESLNFMSRAVSSAIRDLEYEKETMALILEGLSEGILAVDEAGDILHENEAAWKLLGGPEDPAYQAVRAALLAKHEEPAWDGRWTDRGRTLYFAVSRLPSDGGRRGTVALIRDITEEERLERTRHDYVANISHELRTPLSSIRGLGEGLRDGMVTEEKDRLRCYSIIADEANRLSRLVNDLLELSSLQSNPAAFDMETVDSNELIYDLWDRNASLFAEKQVRFDRALPEEPLPPVRSNEDRLAQVLTIFLDNARKYTLPGGSVTLGAERTEGGTRFFVRDTGIGMDEETQSLAFERFHQAEKGRSDKGSGLGLAIAREVLQKMEIAIRLESRPGEGSEFSFVVPDQEK